METQIQPQSTNALAVDLTPFNGLNQRVATLVQQSKDLKITDHESAQVVVMRLKDTTTMEKELKSLVDHLKAPLKAENEKIDAKKKPLETLLASAKSAFKSLAAAWEAEQEQVRNEKIRQAEEERKRKEEEARLAALKDVTPVAPTGFDSLLVDPVQTVNEQEQRQIAATIEAEQNIHLAQKDFQREKKKIESTAIKGKRMVKKFRVADESLIPREFLVPNLVKLRLAVIGEGRQVPGVETWEEADFVARGH